MAELHTLKQRPGIAEEAVRIKKERLNEAEIGWGVLRYVLA